ncbi:hypothetical protein CRENBAI_010637 [Crenichthys baileyi]|uniref:Uncharacterized protein n=1 Tax=Crenichthys baileyi TaxID=28760 RepID=A0AAV9S570_9TELE
MAGITCFRQRHCMKMILCVYIQQLVLAYLYQLFKSAYPCRVTGVLVPISSDHCARSKAELDGLPVTQTHTHTLRQFYLQAHAAMLTECKGAGDAAISPPVLILGSILDHFTQRFQLLQACNVY